MSMIPCFFIVSIFRKTISSARQKVWLSPFPALCYTERRIIYIITVWKGAQYGTPAY